MEEPEPTTELTKYAKSLITAVEYLQRQTVKTHGDLTLSNIRYLPISSNCDLLVSEPIVNNDPHWRQIATHNLKTTIENKDDCLRILNALNLNYTDEWIQYCIHADMIEILKQLQLELCYNNFMK